ncbi:MAG: ComF family protein [Tannerella sp.]|jgi:ComF family protein|nr:ComF family protein [Tannerella sp.]
MKQTIWNNLVNLFYPNLCLLCEKPLIEHEQQLCLHCLYDLPRANYHKRPDNPILKLYAGIPQLQKAAGFLLYEKEGKVQSLIHSFKYRNNKQLAKQLGRIAASELQTDNFFNDIDLLVPVPLHPKKERKRGYNQSEWIAQGIASFTNKPIVSDILFRTIHTTTQTSKLRYERHLNVEKIFSLHNTKSFENKHILLIDDVITTGATSLSCIETLANVPDIRISLFALSIVEIR